MKEKTYMLSPDMRNAIETGPQSLHDALLAMIEHYVNELDRLARDNPLPDVLYNFYEASELFNNEKPHGHEISCKKGCAFCCHIQVVLTQQEADCIKQYCEENDIPIDYEYFEKQRELTEENHARSEASKCAFLKDNLCTVYAARPFNCRNYFVVSEPVLCDVSKNPKTQVLRFFNFEKHAFHSAFLTYLARKKAEIKQDSMARTF